MPIEHFKHLLQKFDMYYTKKNQNLNLWYKIEVVVRNNMKLGAFVLNMQFRNQKLKI